MKYLPIITISALSACFVFGFVGLVLSVKHSYSPLLFDALLIMVLTSASITFLVWLKSGKRSPLTRIQNGLAGSAIVIASWIPPLILVNIPETEWQITIRTGRSYWITTMAVIDVHTQAYVPSWDSQQYSHSLWEKRPQSHGNQAT